jgi:NADH-quinone oxidoreductase subunit G
MQAAANLLGSTGRVGRPNNGLIPVWPGANTQGAFDIGYSAEATAQALKQKVVIVAGADVDPAELKNTDFVVAVSMFPDATTEDADVVLPRQSVPERDGTFTNGERRVQRFYTAQGFIGETLPDWKIFAELHHLLDDSYRVKTSAGAVMADITKNVANYAEMGYKNLARVERQFPDVGGDDLYYGGTAYNNRGGVGVQWPVAAEDKSRKITLRPVDAGKAKKSRGLLAVPVRKLYDRSPEFMASAMMHQRIPQPFVEINAADAAKAKIANGDTVTVEIGKQKIKVTARVNGTAPQGVVLVPMNTLDEPVPSVPSSVSLKK